MLEKWSAQFRWQARIVEAITEAAERKLAEAAEIDAESFLKSSRVIAKAIDLADRGSKTMLPQDLVKIRESVRKPQPKGATNINVKLDVQLTQFLQEIAEADGLTEIERQELEADVKTFLKARPS